MGHDELLCLVEYEHSVDYCLCLVIDDTDKLWDDDNEHLDLRLLAPELPRHYKCELRALRDILPTLRMNYMRIRYLQLLLARTLLPLVAGPWMENHLAVYDVSILCIVDRDQYHPQLDNLFLPSRFGAFGSQTQRSRYSHPFPSIESLGIFMAEIEMGVLTDEELRSKSSSKTAKTLLAQCQDKLPETGGVLQAISFCIDKQSFMDFRSLKGKAGFGNADEFSALYYRHIIRPLEKDLVDGCMWTWDEASLEFPKSIDDPIVTHFGSLTDTRGSNQVQQGSLKQSVPLDVKAEATPEYSVNLQPKRDCSSSRYETVYDARGCLAADNLCVALTTVSCQSTYIAQKLEDA